jgi:hypothetical protein
MSRPLLSKSFSILHSFITPSFDAIWASLVKERRQIKIQVHQFHKRYYNEILDISVLNMANATSLYSVVTAVFYDSQFRHVLFA